MLFYAPFFVFFFLPLVLASFFATPQKYSRMILLFWSFIFYFWGEPRFFPLAIISAILDFYLCKQIFTASTPSRAKLFLTLGILQNILLLFYFKYLTFLMGSVNEFFAYFHMTPLPLPAIALPIGVSFLVFEKITYLVDIYRKMGKPAESLRTYLLYVFLFPKLLAGPIVKYHDIASQLNQNHKTIDNLLIGFRRFLLGLVKKVLLADTLSEVADEVFGFPSDNIGFSQAWLGMICFTLQIYFDFSAYSDMAIGLARMLGFRLFENFNMPYIAKNFSEFWRRWHISLSSWIKEYLYIPLGGNKGGVSRTYFNLWLCFLLSGLWHGASFNFILWGAYNGFFLVTDKLFWLRISKNFPNVVNVVLTLLFVMFGWIIFRANSWEHIQHYFFALFHFGQEGAHIYVTQNQWFAIFVGAALCLTPLFYRYEIILNRWQTWIGAQTIENCGLALLSLLALAKALTVSFSSFLYFRF